MLREKLNEINGKLTLKCALAVVKNNLRSMRLISSALLFSAVRPTVVAVPSGFAK